MENLKPKCGTCYYFTLAGLLRACSHPDNLRIMLGGPVKCEFYEDQETKCLPTQEQWWKERIHDKEVLELLCK